MADASYIVGQLNAPPFNLKLQHHKFSDLRGLDLLQKVYDVYAHIVPAKPVSVSAEADPTARLLEFLRAVKYKPSVDPVAFRAALAAGDREQCYSLLKWTLSQLPVLQKRAMVGFYLAIPEVPAEFRGITEIAGRMHEIRELQEEFKALHQDVEATKSEFAEPEALRKRIQRRENDRASLSTRIVRAKEKAEAQANFQQLAPLCKRLADVTVALDDLKADLVEERDKRDKLEREAGRAATRLADVQAALADGAGAAAVQRLREEAAALREQVHNALPRVIEERRKKLHELSEVRENGIDNENGLKRLRDAEARLRADIAAAQANNAARRKELIAANDPDFRKLQQAQDQATKRARKREEMETRAARLQTKLDAVQRQLDRASAASAAATSGGRSGAIDPEVWTAKFETVRGLLPVYKAHKAEEAAMASECEVLKFTLRELETEQRRLLAAIQETEAARGAAGYAEAAVALEKVSEQKGETDQLKGAKLDEISAVVTQINQKIKDKKGVLAPQIKDLRELRARLEAAKTEHGSARAEYLSTQQAAENEFRGLDEEVSQLQKAVAQAETTYHDQKPLESLYNALTHATQSSDESARLLRGLEEATKAEQARLKELKGQEAAARGAARSGADTADVLQSLADLLNAKLKLMRGDGAFMAGGLDFGGMAVTNSQYETGSGNVLSLA